MQIFAEGSREMVEEEVRGGEEAAEAEAAW
jgi:hypothetical protein